MAATLFLKSTCTTCRDVRGLVRRIGAQVIERDYAKEPLTRVEVERIVDTAGSVAAVLNTRHAITKANGWRDKPPSKATFVTATLSEPNLLRRPILVAGRKIVIGKDEAGVRELFASK
jgi:arsenate reductase-like glutaredoxin family protein